MILSIAFGVVLVTAKWKTSYAVKIKETFEHQPVFLLGKKRTRGCARIEGRKRWSGELICLLVLFWSASFAIFMIHLDDSPVAPENRKSQAQLLYLKRSTFYNTSALSDVYQVWRLS